MIRLARACSTAADASADDELFDGQHEDLMIRRLPSSSISSQDSFSSTDSDDISASCCSASDDASGDEEDDDGRLLNPVPSFIRAGTAGNQSVNDDEDDEAKSTATKEDKMTPEEKSKALRYLVS